ncbi:MAG TPA: tRNA dihydrouridine synthase DusB [Pelotomaculum sp.]|nr:tRNA dihydrouridine synthase DusB [Pelotomaculum sp.]
MKIGSVQLENAVISAPMAGITDKAYRILAKEAGCGLVCTEMVSDQALLYGNVKTGAILNIAGESRPVSIQIFGSDPAYMAGAAKIVEGCGASLIDINMGCPTPKIVRNGEGAALMKDVAKAAKIVKSVADSVQVSVTVKMRKGWDEKSVNAVELARAVVDAGAAAITVHGRTRSQFYCGKADWGAIAAVKKAVNVPVVGNGDIWSPIDAGAMIEETGCDAVMIGRAALGNPWMFSRTVHFLKYGELPPEPKPAEKVAMAQRHLDLLVQFKGERVAVWEMRKHAAWYTRGMRGSARLRDLINKAKSREEISSIFVLFEENVKN